VSFKLSEIGLRSLQGSDKLLSTVLIPVTYELKLFKIIKRVIIAGIFYAPYDALQMRSAAGMNLVPAHPNSASVIPHQADNFLNI
jgi:hypothetical protein